MLTYLLPASLISWIAETVKARVERWAGIADRQLDQAEAELAARQAFVALPAPERPVVGIQSNGRKAHAK